MSETARKVESVARLVPDDWYDSARVAGGSGALTRRIVRELGVSEFVAFHATTVVVRRVGVARGWLS